jgi:tyrosinase
MEIAEEYPQSVREEYQTAAKTLRVPFWDWAADSDVPPCTVPYQLTINVPSGSSTRQANVPNPLAGYKFPQAAVQGRYGSFPGDSQVTRCSGWGESYPQSGNYRLSQRNLRQNTVSLSKKDIHYLT